MKLFVFKLANETINTLRSHYVGVEGTRIRRYQQTKFGDSIFERTPGKKGNPRNRDFKLILMPSEQTEVYKETGTNTPSY